MFLSDQRRPCTCLDAVHNIFPAVAGNTYHVMCAAFTPEPALRFWQDEFYNVLKKTDEFDLSQHSACHRDAMTVATFCSFSFLLAI